MPRLIDISPLVSPRLGVWPGDVPFARAAGLRLEDGASCELSSIQTTLHLGAHADAPCHRLRGARPIHVMPLETFYGPCQVVEVRVPRGARIRPADLRVAVRAPRVLFKTGTFPDPETFTIDFAGLSPELVETLHEAGVLLVGIDTPSVDPFEDERLESHGALAKRGIVNLEGLVLSGVPAGRYTLVALPLRLEGAEASPLRAALLAG